MHNNIPTKTHLMSSTPVTETNLIALYEKPMATTLKVSVVIPTKNEAENLPLVLPRIPTWVYEVIIIDGHSTDGTIEIAQKLVPHNKLRCITQTGKGKGDALREGFKAAQGNIIVMIDADGSMAPEEIPLYVGALMAGADFVKGSRFLQGGGTDDMDFLRWMGNWGFTRIVQVLFGGSYSDLCYGYSAFWSHVVPQLGLQSEGFEIETEMNIRALKSKMKVVEVPSFEAERIYGNSNLNTFKDGWRVLKQIVREYMDWTKPTLSPALRNPEYMNALKTLEQEAHHLATMVNNNLISPQAHKLAYEALQEANKTIRQMMAPSELMREDNLLTQA